MKSSTPRRLRANQFAITNDSFHRQLMYRICPGIKSDAEKGGEARQFKFPPACGADG